MRPRSSTRLGLFALLLGAVVLSLFGSLLAANRALNTADQDAVELDSHRAALIIERELRIDAQQLTEMFGPLLATARPDTAIPPAFDAVWVLDTTGHVAWSRRAPGVPELDAAVRAVATPTGSVSWPSVRPIGSAADSDGAVLIAMPLQHRGRSLGTAVGVVRASRVLQSLPDTTRRSRLALLADGHVIARTSDIAGWRSYLSATTPVRLGSDDLSIEVAHVQSGRVLRTALWMLGVVALIGLVLGLARERQQAIHLADRTAELERLYEEVARSNRMKSEFLANVSHELRTPLNAIVGFVEMLREGVYGELAPRQALPVDRIAASATHLRQLVDRLLDIAKIAAGRLEVHQEPLVLRPFVLNVASEMESLVSERGLALSIGVTPTLPRIRTDQTHLRQILINLIGNAVKYTPSGGITVSARLLGDGVAPATDAAVDRAAAPPDPHRPWIALQVADTGVGIAAADQERIFDEFEQVNAGARTDSARRGTGLGLAISRRLARLLGGDLTVFSELGRGSVFTVWLPLEPPEKKAE